MASPGHPKLSNKRVGRPAATDSAVTRAQLLESARKNFARYGYANASNAFIADEAGLTSGTIYHHFGGKRALYQAVAEDCATLVLERIVASFDPDAHFLSNLMNAIAATGATNAQHPFLAEFALNIEGEAQRHPELRDIEEMFHSKLGAFYKDLTSKAIASGAVTRGIDLPPLMDLISSLRNAAACLSVRLGAGSPRHRRALEVLSELIDGELFRPL